jgi:predicted ATPase
LRRFSSIRLRCPLPGSGAPAGFEPLLAGLPVRGIVPPAALVITCGLPATGKSTITRALGERGFEVISSDVVRKTGGHCPDGSKAGGFERGIYAADFTERTYDALLVRARSRLLVGQSVALDAS